MQKWKTWAGYAGTLVCAVGCGSQESAAPESANATPAKGATQTETTGGVAIVDLDAVAKRLGREAEINDAVAAREAQLNGELRKLQSSLREQLQQKQEEFGEVPTRAQQKELQALESQIATRLAQARSQAMRELGRYRTQLVGRFREEVKPAARQVAQERGLTIVAPKNEDFFLTIESNAEITDGVIERMIANAGSQSKPSSSGGEVQQISHEEPAKTNPPDEPKE